MKQISFFLLIITLFLGCSKNRQPLKNVNLIKTSFLNLPGLQQQNYDEFLNNFIHNCKSTKGQRIYN